VRPEVRATVEAVAVLIAGGQAEVRQADLRKQLQLDKSAISRRVADAVDRGYLRNLEDKKGRQARLVTGDPLPEDTDVLPKQSDEISMGPAQPVASMGWTLRTPSCKSLTRKVAS